MNLQNFVFGTMLVVIAMLNDAARSEAAELNWSHNLYDGFLQAQREQKPLVVYFTCRCEKESCWARRVEQEVFQTGGLDGFVDQAIFVEARPGDEDTHGNYAQLKTDLELTRFPAFIVLDVLPNTIKECGRILGYHKPQDYTAHVAKALEVWDARHPKLMTRVSASNPSIPRNWSSYLNRGLGFQATFPSEPIVSLVDDASQTFKVHSTVPRGGQEYTIHVQDLSPDLRGDTDAGAWLKGWARACAVAEKGEATDVTLLNQAGPTTCQFYIVEVAGRRIFAVRAVLCGMRLYTLRAKTEDNEDADLAAQFFLQSFQTIEKQEVSTRKQEEAISNIPPLP